MTHGALMAYEVWVVARRDWAETVNARTIGQAKVSYWRDVTDAWPGIPYTAIRCRRIGPPASSADFIRCTTSRGLPDVRCGDRVRLKDDGSHGVIIGHNSSANFDVLFDADSRWRNQVMNVHPASCVIVDSHVLRDAPAPRAEKR